jgi:hypothetical protein
MVLGMAQGMICETYTMLVLPSLNDGWVEVVFRMETGAFSS